MGTINARDFDDPISRRLARGESLGTQNRNPRHPIGNSRSPWLGLMFVSIGRLPRVVSGGSCADGAPVPWQELVETGGWMIADPGKHVGEPSTRIDIIEPGGDHK